MKSRIATVVLWSARIMASSVMLFVLFMIGSQMIGADQAGFGFQSNNEIALFLYFPLITCLGLALAFIKEGIGGLIATLSLIGVGILDPSLLEDFSFFVIFGFPGVLFMLYWLLNRKK